MSSKPTKLQAFAVRFWTILFFVGFLALPGITLLLLFTPFNILILLYLSWVFLIDRKTCERGGRTIEYFRNFFMWKHFAAYFPLTSVLSAPLQLDPNRNYIFTGFPHGIFCVGVTVDFRSNHGNFKKFFPNHKAYSITLPFNFYLPFYREIILGVGSCSSSLKSVGYLLSDPKGGKAVGIVPGGATEAQYSEPGGIYKLVLRSRRGFVKLALKYGTPIIPSFSFGENDIFEQVHIRKDSRKGKLLQFLKWLTRIHFVIPKHGLSGLVPYPKPITVVYGTPIDVTKTESPTQLQIDELHQRVVGQVMDLFEKYKYQYLKDPEDAKLIIL